MKLIPSWILAAFVVFAAASAASPQVKDLSYEDSLIRLSEIVGSVHYIRTLCAQGDEGWRDKMQALIDLEGGDGPFKKRLTAAFNHGYRAFAAVHVKCNEVALQAEQQYRKEGLELASAIIARYGN